VLGAGDLDEGGAVDNGVVHAVRPEVNY
jgi:hypothetical protein